MPEDKEEEKALQREEIPQPGIRDYIGKAPASKTTDDTGTGSIQSVKDAVKANISRLYPQSAMFQGGLALYSLPVLAPSAPVQQIHTSKSYQGFEATTRASPMHLPSLDISCEGSNLDHYED